MQVPTESDLVADASALLRELRQRGLTLAIAESCTGGLISAVLTEVSGSSDVVERGFVTYSNEAKSDLLGVLADVIEEKGAVSEEVARAMAEGALTRSRADVAVAVTGIAGPGGGSPEKPVGLVHIAAQRAGQEVAHLRCEFGDVGRAEIRRLSVAEAFRLVRAFL